LRPSSIKSTSIVVGFPQILAVSRSLKSQNPVNLNPTRKGKEKMIKKSFLITICTAIILLSIVGVTPAFSMEPGLGEGYATIYVSPASINFTSPPTTNGTKFTVQVRVKNYSQVAGWQVKLVWDKSLLNTSATDAGYASDFIFPPGSYNPMSPYFGDYNTTHRYVIMTTTTIGAVEYAGTDAGLMKVNFTIIKTPDLGKVLSCKLWLEPVDTYTLDEWIEENDEERIDGYYKISSSVLETKTRFDFIPNPAATGQAVTLLGNLTTIDDSPIAGASLTLKVGGSPVTTLTTNSTGWFKLGFPAPAVGSYMIRIEYAGSAQYLPSFDEEVLVVTTGLSIAIYTDKYLYHAGNTMHLGLDVSNIGKTIAVSFKIWIRLPSGANFTYMYYPSVTIPAGMKYSNPDFKLITLPSIAPGIYTWHAAFLETSTQKIIVEDTAEWQFS